MQRRRDVWITCGARSHAIGKTARYDQAGFRSARLDEADLRNARLGGAFLVGASLRSADLRGAYLRLAKLDGADLSDANMHDTEGLTQAQLDTAHLSSGTTVPQGLKGTENAKG